MARRIKLRLKTEKNPDPERVGRAHRAIVKLLCPEVFALNAESEAVLAESARFLERMQLAELGPEKVAQLSRIAQLEAELAKLKESVA